MRKLASEHPSEKVGAEIRKLYSWNNEGDKLIGARLCTGEDDLLLVSEEGQALRFTADDGVQITLPREVADDPDRFEVAHNPDGTLSILIKGLQSLRKS